MSRLGINQLRLLRTLSTRLILVIGDKRSRRLCELGLCESLPDGNAVRITASGLRALADAADAGRLPIFDTTIERMVADIRERNAK